MKTSLLARLALLAPLSTAHAADLPLRKGPPDLPPPAPQSSFEGLYAGGQIGALGFGDRAQSIFVPGNAALTHTTSHAASLTGGVHAGYDWRYGPIVFGLIADVSGAHAASNNVDAFFGYAVHNSLDVHASLRGRVGYAFFDRALLYATGGLDVAHLRHDYTAPFGTQTTHVVAATPTVGVGVEYAIDPHWRARLEYRFSGALTPKEAENFPRPGLATRNAFGDAALTAGVSYNFGK